MPIPSIKGGDIVVVPLTNKYHRNFLPLTANEEEPVTQGYYDGASVHHVLMRPHIHKDEADAHTRPKARPIEVGDFMKGGQSLG